MGAKKIRKRGKPDIDRVNRALRGIELISGIEVPPGVAPVPIWAFTRPIPDDPDAPIPAIQPELVDPVVIVSDCYLVEDFEKTGLRIARLEDLDQEKVLLWMIDKSRDLDRRRVDDEYAIDFGPEIKNRTMGGTLAELAKIGRLRIVATHDGSKVITQAVFSREELQEDPAVVEALSRQLFPNKPQ